jgi:hypothetical protein
MFGDRGRFATQNSESCADRGGYWKGGLVVAPGRTLRSALAGSRALPDPTALELTKELPDRFTSLIPTIEIGLFEHDAPY